MQNRIGPNKAGPWGILQTLADGIKLFFKEDLIPDKSDRFVFKLAPYLSFVPAFLVWSVIPLGGDFSGGKTGEVVWFDHVTRLQLADPADRRAAAAGAQRDRGVRHHAGRLVQRLEVPAARFGACLGADGQLRSCARPQPGSGDPGVRHVEHQRHRRRIRSSISRWHVASYRIRAVRHLPDLGDRRAEPAAVRPRRGRAGAGRRIQHRVLQHPVRPVLPRRVHEHGHDERGHRDAVLRRPAAAEDRRQRQHPRRSSARSPARSGSS